VERFGLRRAVGHLDSRLTRPGRNDNGSKEGMIMRGSRRSLRKQERRVVKAQADVVDAEADIQRVETLPWYRQKTVGAAIQAAVTQRGSKE
jgi:hypothetical protein